MKRRTEERLLWTSAASCLAIAGGAWLAGMRTATGDATASDSLTAPIAPVFGRQTSAGLIAVANRVAERDPFRAERRAAPLPYSYVAEGMPAPPPPPLAPPKPALVLRGTIGGPTWEALLEGIPGREGSILVRQGDTLAGLRLRRVSLDTVVVSGMDTTWTLTVKRTWP